MSDVITLADLTICIPAYKATETIAATLQSLQIQTDKRFETMVVQDGPDDELYKVIDENRKGLQLHHIVLKENGGCGHARNVGLDACKTKYIAYLDADDLYMPYAVDHINQAIAFHFDWYAGKFLQRTPRGFVIRGNEHNTWCHGRVYDIEFLKFHGIRFPEDLRIADDFPMNILCREFGVEVREGDLPIALYQPNTGSATRKDDAHQKQAYEYIEGNLFYVRTAMRHRAADKLNQLPQVIVMSYFYLDYAKQKGWDCVPKMEDDFKALIKYVKLPALLEDDSFLAWLKKALLIPNRPYPDIPEPPHETFWDMIGRLT